MKRETIVLALSVAWLACCHAATYYVSASRPDDSGDGTSWATAKRTIQAAVDLAVAGDTVLVTNGVYREGGRAEVAGTSLTNRVYCPLNVSIVAVSSNPSDTVIEGAPDGVTLGCGPRAIRGYRGGVGSVLAGFTVTNGYTWDAGGTAWKDLYGGGAWSGIVSNCLIVGNTAVQYGGGRSYGTTYDSVLRNNTALSGAGAGVSVGLYRCVISNNTATSVGGGICNNCAAYDCMILNNTAGAGGAISMACLASNCVIRGNTALNYGSVAGYSQATWHKLYNCLITENHAPYGTMYQRLDNGQPNAHGTLINCTVVSNTADTAGACAGLVGQIGGPGTYSITNCIIRFNYNITDGVETNYRFAATNTWIANTCIYPDVSGEAYDNGSNIGSDPVFVGDGDYKLMYRSPCVDSGQNISTLSNDIDNVTRPIDGKGNGIAAYDMGCYEYIPPPCGTILSFR